MNASISYIKERNTIFLLNIILICRQQKPNESERMLSLERQLQLYLGNIKRTHIMTNMLKSLYMSRKIQNGHHLADCILKFIFMKEIRILVKFGLTFVLMRLISNKSILPGPGGMLDAKPLSEPMLSISTDATVSRPQYVKHYRLPFY